MSNSSVRKSHQLNLTSYQPATGSKWADVLRELRAFEAEPELSIFKATYTRVKTDSGEQFYGAISALTDDDPKPYLLVQEQTHSTGTGIVELSTPPSLEATFRAYTLRLTFKGVFVDAIQVSRGSWWLGAITAESPDALPTQVKSLLESRVSVAAQVTGDLITSHDRIASVLEVIAECNKNGRIIDDQSTRLEGSDLENATRNVVTFLPSSYKATSAPSWYKSGCGFTPSDSD